MKIIIKILPLVLFIAIIGCTDEFNEQGAFISVSESFYAEIAGGGEDSAVVLLETTAIPEEDGSIEISVSDTAGVYTNPAYNDRAKIILQIAKGTTNASFTVKYMKDDILEGKDIEFTITRVSGGVVGVAKKTFIVRVLPAAGSEFFEDFANDLGDFTSYSVTGDEEWEHASFLDGSALMSGYSGGSNANDDWLFTPKIDLSSSAAATLEFVHAVNVYSATLEDISLHISNDYSGNGDPNSATWVEITGWEKGDGGSFDEVESGIISLDDYLGDTAVYVAFRYVSTDDATATWEIGSVTIRGAKVGGSGSNGGGGGSGGDIILQEDFSSDIDNFLTYSVVGSQEWEWESFLNGSAVMTGFVNPDRFANEDWLITPEIDLSEVEAANLSFFHVINFAGSLDNMTVQVSTNYSGIGDPSAASWTELTGWDKGPNNSWTGLESGEISLTGFAGEPSVYIGFKYVSTSSDAGTWEIGSVTIKEGEAEGGGGGGNGHTSGDPVDSLKMDFDSFSNNDPIEIEGWLNVATAGERTWLAKEFESNVYAQATGFNSGLSSMVTWLITPPVKMDADKILSFTTAQAFWAHSGDPLEVLVSTDFSGNSEDIESATWTKLNATIASQNDAEHAWIESGDIDLSGYSSNIFIAFRYTGSATESTSLRIDDIYIGSGGVGGTGGQEIVLLEEDFESLSDRDEVAIEGWNNVASEGSRTWQAREFSGNMYAQATAYSSDESSNVSWLVTRGVDLDASTSEILTFKTKDGYDDGAILDALISTDFSGDVTTAIWTKLDAVISTGNTNGYASDFLDSGNIDLSSYNGTIHIAFRYTGGDPGATTTFQVDDIKITGEE